MNSAEPDSAAPQTVPVMPVSTRLPDNLARQTLLLVKEDPFFIAPQGEGKYMGRLSSWVRCTTCNLRCAWANPDGSVTLCDTAYSSHVPSYRRETAQMVFDRLTGTPPGHVVITGGEPARQPSLLQLIDPLEAAGKRVTVETNGTRFFDSAATLVSLSPKTRSSGSGLERLSDPAADGSDTDGFLSSPTLPGAERASRFSQQRDAHHQDRYRPEVLQRFLESYGPQRVQFKFVAHREEDLIEIMDDYVAPLRIPPETVYLMPQGTTHTQLQERAAWVIEKCVKHGFNYSDRLHIRIYGNRPGV
jgi:7-carboxy-7-deazaguanine synthase